MTSHSNDLEKWMDQAKAVTEPNFYAIPVHVLIGESVEVAAAVIKYWDPSDTRPGLCSAGDKMTRDLADEILSLHIALRQAQTAYQLSIDKSTNHTELISSGETLLAELTATLEWYFDDGITDTWDNKLEVLNKAHKNNSAADELAQALHDYATLAKPHANKLEGLGGFDVTNIDRAFDIANSLGQVRQTPEPKSDTLVEMQLLRDQIAHLLSQRVRLARSAARFVFRNQPDLVREFTSSYERRRRAAARRHKAKLEGGVNAG